MIIIHKKNDSAILEYYNKDGKIVETQKKYLTGVDLLDQDSDTKIIMSSYNTPFFEINDSQLKKESVYIEIDKPKSRVKNVEEIYKYFE